MDWSGTIDVVLSSSLFSAKRTLEIRRTVSVFASFLDVLGELGEIDPVIKYSSILSVLWNHDDWIICRFTVSVVV